MIFLERNEWNALYEYVSLVLRHRTKASHKIQNILLCTWIVEISLRRSRKDDKKCEELRRFLREQHEKCNLNEDVVMSLLRSHGRFSLVIYFASLLEKHEYAISYLVSRGQYSEALNRIESILAKSEKTKDRVVSIMMLHSAILLTNEPRRTIELFRSVQLPISHIISSLICYDRKWRSEYLSSSQKTHQHHFGLEYVQYCIQTTKSEEKALHRYLLSLYETLPRTHPQLEKSLCRYLEDNLDRVDISCAMRLCERFLGDDEEEDEDKKTLRVRGEALEYHICISRSFIHNSFFL